MKIKAASDHSLKLRLTPKEAALLDAYLHRASEKYHVLMNTEVAEMHAAICRGATALWFPVEERPANED